MNSPNLTTREPPLGPVNLPVATWSHDPVQARAMTKSDIARMRRWHRDAVRRSLAVGYDLVYVYAGHALGIQYYFCRRGTTPGPTSTAAACVTGPGCCASC